MVHLYALPRFVVLSLVLTLPLVALGDEVGNPSGGGSSIEWPVSATSYERIELRVVDPYGEIHNKEFPSGKHPSFRLADLAEVIDGHYSYELLLIPKVSTELAQQLQKARADGDEAAARKLLRNAGLSDLTTQSGGFQVEKGSIVTPGLTEPGADSTPAASATAATSAGGLGSNGAPGRVAVQDVVFNDDLIVAAHACVGPFCINGELFSADTFRLKEPTVAVHFEDTSTGPGFPSNDWRIRINDNTSGGLNYFSIEDTTGIKIPFLVKAGATTNSLHVDSTGRIGFRTSTPAKDLHVNTGDTPAIRFEQNGSGGFTAQTWDIAGNEVNFFVRDATNGDLMPFRIRPSAPTSSIDISARGNVGVGAAGAEQKLHVRAGTSGENANTIGLVENPNASGLSAAAVQQSKADVAVTSLIAHGSGRTLTRFGQTLGGFSEVLNAAGDGLIVGTLGATPLILGTNSTARMTIASTGAITVPGNFTVSGVKNFATVDPADANRALYYTALEGPEAGTYFRGSAKTSNGEVMIELPGYFSRLTESERMTVQLTAIGAPGLLYVAEKSPERLVVRVAEGAPDLAFDYWVSGVRKGYLDYEVERAGAFPVHQ